MKLIQLNHLNKELQGVEAISDYTSYKRRRATQQNRMNYKSEEDVWSASYRKLPLHPEQVTELKGVREISRMLIRVSIY